MMEETARKRNGSVSGAVVIGTGPTALRFFEKLNNKKRQRYHIIGFIGDETDNLPAPRLCGYEELASYLLSTDADEIIIATEAEQVPMMPGIISICEESGHRYSIHSAEGFPKSEPVTESPKENAGTRPSGRNKLNSTFCRFLKRTFDLLLSALLILVLWPLMLVIAIGVRFTGKGSVLVRERILGRRRKPFVMLKFRSTESVQDGSTAEDVSEEDAPATEISAEDVSIDNAFSGNASVPDIPVEDSGVESVKIAPFRQWIRNTKLDLLPRLFNILTGAMSFVGPHPEPRSFFRQFRDSMPGFMQRYRMRPGLIGWARLIKRRRDELIPEEEWIRYDLWYVANWSPHLDLSIIKKTLFDRKTYSEAAEERKKVEEEWKAAEEARKAQEEEERKAQEEEARKAAEEARKAAIAEQEAAAREAQKAAKEATKAIKKADKAAPEKSRSMPADTIPAPAPVAAAAVDDLTKDITKRNKNKWSNGKVLLAIAGYFGRPMLIFLAPLVLLYYLCYRMDISVSETMYVPLEVVSLILFIATAVLTINKRTAVQVILFFNLLWMILTRFLHNDLTVTPHGVCYFAAMFFAFYSCGILLKNRQREFFMDVVALVVGGMLLLWGLVGFATALTGQPLPGFEMIRLLAEKTPALMTFISFYGTHRNISSTYFVIMMGFSIYQYVRHRTRFWKIMAILFVPICYVMVAMQHSRSNYMAASIVLSVALMSMVLEKLTERVGRLRALHVVLLFAAGMLCVFVFLIGFYKANIFMEILGIKFREAWAVIADHFGLPKFNYTVKFTDPRNLTKEITTLNRRTEIWKNAIPVLKEHSEILTIGRPENLIMESINEKGLWRKEPHMHNALLQQLMTVGVPGALLYVATFGIICKSIFLSIRQTGQKETTANRVLSGILLAMFAYGILEPLLSPKIPLASLLFCLIAGCLEGEQRKIRMRIQREDES